MLQNILRVDRDHSKDYEVVVSEKSLKVIKLFGITVFKRDWYVLNRNNDTINTNKSKSVGFKSTKDEKSSRTKE
jgi:hypothetical protein